MTMLTQFLKGNFRQMNSTNNSMQQDNNNNDNNNSFSSLKPSSSRGVVDMDWSELHSIGETNSLFDSSNDNNDDAVATVKSSTEFSDDQRSMMTLEVSSGSNPPDLYQEDNIEVGPRILCTPVVFVRNNADVVAVTLEQEDDNSNAVIETVTSIFNLALVHHSKSMLVDAMEMYQACVNTVIVVLKKKHHSPCCQALLEIGMRAHNNIGIMVYAERNYKAAEAHFQASLLFSKQLICTLENHQNQQYQLEYSTILSNICRVLWMRGEAGTSVTFYTGLQDILRILSSILPWNHSDVAAAHYNLAVAEFTTRRNSPQAAVEHLMQYLKAAAHRIYSSGQQENDLNVIPALRYLLLIQNNNEQAAEDCTMSQVLLRGIFILLNQPLHDADKKLPASHDVATVLNGIGSLLFNKGDMEMSLLFFQAELRVDEDLLLKDSSNPMCVSAACHNIGRVLQELQDNEQAVFYYERALKPIYGENVMLDYNSCRTLPACKCNVVLSSSNMNFLATIWYDIGIIHQKLACMSKALCAFEISLKLKQPVSSSDYVDIACLNFNIGVLQMEEENRPDVASKYLEQVLVARREYLEMTGRCMNKLTDKLCIRVLQKLALMYMDQNTSTINNNIQPAINTLREVLRILINSTEFDNITRIKDMAQILRSISEYYHTLGDLSSALVVAQDCVRQHELHAQMAMDHGSTTTMSFEEQLATMEQLLSSLLLLGSLYHEMCEPIEAHAVHQRALTMIQLATEMPLPASCPLILRNMCELAKLLGTTPFASAA